MSDPVSRARWSRAGRARWRAWWLQKLDRLSRSVVDFAGLLTDARKRGFNIAALDLGLDLSTPQGERVANVIASVAQWEPRIVGERTREDLAIKRAQGVRLG